MFVVKTHEERSVSWWFERRHMIEFSPSFQRKGKIWDDRRKALLIDTIINQYDVPKFYLADFRAFNSELNLSDKDYAVIDGKQRLETIFGFISNGFPLAKNFKSYVESGQDLSGLFYHEILFRFPQIAYRIMDFVLPVMQVITDEKNRIDDLYVRLNTGISLNGAELRNAMPGVVPDLLRRIVLHEFFEKKVSFTKARMQDFNVAIKLLIIEEKGTFTDTKKASLDRFTIQGAENIWEDRYIDAYESVMKNLDKMLPVFVERDALLRTEAPVPLYYWLVRNSTNLQLGFVREFILYFQRALDAYRRQPFDRRNPDPLFDDYHAKGRSSNDPGSLQGRYNTLRTMLERFVDEGQSSTNLFP